jgi:hypothetical protein
VSFFVFIRLQFVKNQPWSSMKNIWYLECVHIFKILCLHRFTAYKSTHEFSTAYNKMDYIYFTDDSASKVYLIYVGKINLGYYLEDG